VSHLNDPDRFRLRLDALPPKTKRRVPDASSAPTRSEPFIKGPIPLWWWLRAARLTRSALVVGDYLWYLRGKRTASRRLRPHEAVHEVPVSLHKMANAVRLKRQVLANGLRCLEVDELVTVARHPGCQLVVTLIDARTAERRPL
jgi:hypothetical protein